MSELIDRIFDVTAISKEVADIMAELKIATDGINHYKDAIISLQSEIRKNKGTEELINNSKLLNDNVIKGGVEMKRYEAEVEKLRQKTEQLTNSEKAASIEIAKARLELQAAQKATKEAAIADIEKTASNGKLTGSYTELQKTLNASIIAYKNLSKADIDAGKGRDLLKKIGETQASLKATDAAMGNYQRNVGNYASALEGLTPKIGGFAGTLLDIAKAAKKNKSEMDDLSNANNLGFKSMQQAPKGLSTIIAGFKGLGQTVAAVGKALLANPIGIVIAAIVGAFALMKKAVDSNGEATEKLNRILAPFKALLSGVMHVISGIVSNFLSGVEAIGKFTTSVMMLIPGLDTMAKKTNTLVDLERERQQIAEEHRQEIVNDAKDELAIAELKVKMTRKDLYTNHERLAFAKEADRIYKEMAADDVARATRVYNNKIKQMKAEGKAYKDLTESEKNELKNSEAAMYNIRKEFRESTRKLNSYTSKLIIEMEADEQKAKEDAAKAEQERNDKILAARRRLVDSQLAMMADGEQKQLAISAENFKRQIEELRNNGELTKQLKSNLEKVQQMEVAKIRTEFENKRKEDTEKTNAELLAIELKRIDDIQKGIEKQTQLLSTEYKRQELFLKKEYSKGLLTREQYEKELSELQLKGLEDVNNQQIAALEKLLNDSKLTDDKRAELSAKLAQLRIDNENAVTDASIKAGEDQIKADEDAKNKRIAVAEALANAAGEIFGAISEFAIQQSENRIIEIEKEQTASDKRFEKEQENLDGALMSDENRKAKQQELDDKKAVADKMLADKIQAEKIKQAKWDKANGIVQAIITTGLAILKASLTVPFVPMGLIAAGLAATMGAAQVATIASAQIPAYEKGTDNHPGGLSLWGEKRPEVAVLPSGETFLAEKPTISNFDAGTKIYDSVQAYENAIGKQAIKDFSFDYDKMGEKLKPQNIILDSRGLWGIVSQQNTRRTMINRRYSIR